MQEIKFIRKPEVLYMAGFGSTTLHERVTSKLMCSPIRLGGNVSAYLKHEVEAVLSARTAGFSDEQVKDLVVNLEGKREEVNTALMNSLKERGML